ncbi:EXPERA domain-containing protein [Streptomyces sp. NPDC020799]|uniref:EXPERA domain-containing protein n=1 Tax=Streptomyces sp. NPDC020799 TaxID=3365091 RepID=UPI0037AC6B70
MTPGRPEPAPGDRLVLGFLAFSLTAAFSLELYFVLNFQDIGGRHDLFARGFQLYGAGDRTYSGQGDTYFPFALETINVFLVQLLNCALGYAIVRSRVWRHPLQLVIGSYLSGSVVLYFWHAHAAGYPDMPEHRSWNYFLFYAPNLPWLVGNFCMAVASFRGLVRSLKQGGAHMPGVNHSATSDRTSPHG